MSLKLVLFSYIIFVLAVFVQPIEMSFADSDTPEISEVKKNHKHNKRNHRRDQSYLLRSIEPLQFGKLVPSDRETGIVTIDARTGNKTIEGGVFDLGEEHSAAVFRIRAKVNSKFDIQTPSESQMKPKSGGVSIQDIKIWPEETLTVGLSGQAEFNIGGSLYLPPRAKAGQYRTRIHVYVTEIEE